MRRQESFSRCTATGRRGTDQDVRVILLKYREAGVNLVEAWKPIRKQKLERMKESIKKHEQAKKKKSIWNSLR